MLAELLENGDFTISIRSTRHQSFNVTLMLTATLLVAACGRGGGSSPSSDPVTVGTSDSDTNSSEVVCEEENGQVTVDSLAECMQDAQDDIDTELLFGGSGRLYRGSETVFLHENPLASRDRAADPFSLRREIPFTVLDGDDAIRIERMYSLDRPFGDETRINLVGIASNLSDQL